jgi:hypothetical protein
MVTSHDAVTNKKTKMKKYLYLFLLALSPAALKAQSTYWSLKGNSNLNDTSNFLGTTDHHPLIFRVNRKRSGYIDFDSLKANTTFGYKTLFFNSFGTNNSAFGYKALHENTSGGNNVAVGTMALYSNTFGQNNIAVGAAALQNNTFGGFNIAIGQGALVTNIAGNNNVAIGQASLAQNKRGNDNTATGYIALYFNTASKNTATGSNALYDNSTGASNTATGYLSLFINNVGNNNTATGAGSLFQNSSGNYNTADGVGALTSNQVGSRNTAVGAYADVSDVGFVNSTAIGFGATVDASHKVQVGNIYVKSIGGQVDWTNYSDERIKQDIEENVPGLSFINLLRPVTYRFNTTKENELLGKKDSLNQAKESDIEKIKFTGFLAQDVDKAAKKINYDFSGVDKAGKMLGLRYSEFVVPLVKAVQELSEKNNGLEQINNQLQQQLQALQLRMEKLEALMSNTPQNSSVPSLSSATIAQNVPNPFTGSTVISYSLPAVSNTAHINFYNSSGVIIKSIQLANSKGSISINAADFAAGNYQYALVINNAIVESRKMGVIK